MSLTVALFWLTYISGIGAAIARPAIGVALYVLVYHINPETQWWGASVQGSGLRTSFMVALATGIGILLRPPPVPRAARVLATPLMLTACFVLLSVVSLSWAQVDVARSDRLAEKFLKVFIFFVMLVRCIHSPAQYQMVLCAWLLGVAYIGYEAHGGVGVSLAGRLTGGLGGPDFAESSGLSVHLVSTLPLIGAMFFFARTWLGRGALLAIGALVVNALVLTRTRNAVPGLALVVVTCVLSLPRGFRLKGLAAVCVGTLLSLQLIDPGWWARMHSILNYQSDQPAMTRLAYWRAAYDMVCDNPLGVGLGAFHEVVRSYVPGLTIARSAHNTFFTALAETGWLGAGIWVAIITVTFWRLSAVRRIARDLPAFIDIRMLRRRARFHLDWHAVALRAAIAGYVAGAMFTSRLLTEDFWMLIALAIALHNTALVLRDEHDTVDAPDPTPAWCEATPLPQPDSAATAALPGPTLGEGVA